VITADQTEANPAVKQLTELWESLHCKVRHMTPEDHDYAVARISHFPHALACIGAQVGPKLWTEILLENRDALQRSLSESIDELTLFQEHLKNNDAVAMLDYLTEAKRKRDIIK